MKTRTTIELILLLLLTQLAVASVAAKQDDFKAVVRLIERFYGVKHQGLPFLAKAGMKAARTAAHLKGGEAKRFAEAGSVKVAFFEGEDFSSQPNFLAFRNALNAELDKSWMPFIQTLAPRVGEQSYIFLRDAGQKFNVLVVTFEPGSGTVVQVDLSPKALAELIASPDEMGKTITQEATIIDQE